MGITRITIKQRGYTGEIENCNIDLCYHRERREREGEIILRDDRSRRGFRRE